MIDRSRGSPALAKFFTTEFEGTLVTDFGAAYNAVACADRQMCLVHLLRELEQTLKYKSPGDQWPAFEKKLRRRLGDAIRLWKRRDELDPNSLEVPSKPSDACLFPGVCASSLEFAREMSAAGRVLTEALVSRRARLDKRLSELLATDWQDGHAKRLIKRLRRHQNDRFTFLDHQGVPFENNHAQRSIRPAVILRKNSYGNRSEQGADCQAVMMSIFRTLKQRGHDPIRTIIAATADYLPSEKLQPLPPNTTTLG